MADHSRALRLAERIKVLAASALAKIVKDPDLGFVTFTDARVTPDLRGEIGKQLGIRMTPTLELILDDVPENAGDLNDLLAEAKRRDGELEKLAKGAKHAGDVDPYIQKPQED